LHGTLKIILLGVKKAKKGPQSPNTEFGAQNLYSRVIYPSIGNFTCSKKYYTLGGQKDENKPSEPKNGIWGPKTEFGAQNKYGRVIYPSIGNFTCSKKYYTLGGQKGENKPPEP
jgi:hypothetical protein